VRGSFSVQAEHGARSAHVGFPSRPHHSRCRARNNHLAGLRWCGFIEARREGRTVYNRSANPRVAAMIQLAQSLLAYNAEHVAACCRIGEPRR
jgi:hypothetical protein